MEQNRPHTLDVGQNGNGIYLSQLQIDLLTIVNFQDDLDENGIVIEGTGKEKIKNWVNNICGQFPNKSIEELVPNYETASLEDIKRTIFELYMKSLRNYKEDAFHEINDEKGFLMRIQAKLAPFRLTDEEQRIMFGYLQNKEIKNALKYFVQIRGIENLKKFHHFIPFDFENVKEGTYEQYDELNKKIKEDESIDTILCATGKYSNSVYESNDGMFFDAYLTMKCLEYCKSTGKHMRYHSIFDTEHAKKLQAQGLTSANKEEILADMRSFIDQTFNFIRENNFQLPDETMCIDTIEIFNELVEYNKESKEDYQNIWTRLFGITTEELAQCFDQVQKPDGVSYMYNETMLEECRERRNKVLEVLKQIHDSRPDLLDRFGTQMHLGVSDSKERQSELADEFDMLNQIKEAYSLVLECTEFDMHIEKETILNHINEINNGAITKEQLQEHKSKAIKDVAELALIKGVDFDKVSYWSLLDSTDHNLVRANASLIRYQQSKKGLVDPNQALTISSLFGGLYGAGDRFDILSPMINMKRRESRLENIKKKEKLFTPPTQENNNGNQGEEAHGYMNPAIVVTLLLSSAAVLAFLTLMVLIK